MRPDERRQQLLDLGAELFATQPYEDVHIERVAELADVSRGLLYHYFPNKREFFGQLLVRESQRVQDLTAPDPSQSPLDQLRNGLDAFLDHARKNRHGVRAIHRGSLSGDPEVQKMLAEGNRMQEDRILSVLVPDGTPAPLLRMCVHGWIVFTREMCDEWIEADADPGDVSQADVVSACVNAFVGMMLGLPDHARPPGAAEILAAATEIA